MARGDKQRYSYRGLWQFIRILVIPIILITIFIGLIVIIGRDDDRNNTFDYVIVGSGPAGCINAEYLSRNPRNRVLLLEAGVDGDDDPVIKNINPETNNIVAKYFGKYFWQQAQDYAEVIPNRRNMQLTMGRLRGGSSSINGAQFVRGTDWIFDEGWVALTDDEIWNSTNVREAYKRLEAYYGLSYNPVTRGNNGRLIISDSMANPPQTTPTGMAEKVTLAYEQLTGLSRLSDYNSLDAASRLGPFLHWQTTSRPNGTRSSASVSFLSPDVMARPNLVVKLASTATRVNFDRHKHARSVSYIQNGRERVAHGTKRIILTAGVNTASILQHSGIGNATYLQEIGVPVVYDNPNVGLHMKNHQGFTVIFTKNLTDVPSANPADIFEGGAFLPTPNPNTTFFEDEFASPRRIQVINVNAGPVLVLVILELQAQKSGYIKIRDADPLHASASSDSIFVPPEGDIDRATFANAMIKYACALHDEFQGLGMGPAVDTDYFMVNPPRTICDNATILDEWILDNVVLQAHHWNGAARMGKAGDGISVANSKGSVWGVTGLTIGGDSSSLPINHDGNTQAPSYVAAEIISREVAAGRF